MATFTPLLNTVLQLDDTTFLTPFTIYTNGEVHFDVNKYVAASSAYCHVSARIITSFPCIRNNLLFGSVFFFPGRLFYLWVGHHR